MQIAQIRYYNDNDERNSPYKLYTELCGDTAFKNFGIIKKLGIQTLPGTRVYFNKSITPIVIGATGIYELDLSDNTSAILHSIRFDKTSMETIRNLANGYLLVDILYDEKGGTTT